MLLIGSFTDPWQRKTVVPVFASMSTSSTVSAWCASLIWSPNHIAATPTAEVSMRDVNSTGKANFWDQDDVQNIWILTRYSFFLNIVLFKHSSTTVTAPPTEECQTCWRFSRATNVFCVFFFFEACPSNRLPTINERIETDGKWVWCLQTAWAASNHFTSSYRCS